MILHLDELDNSDNHEDGRSSNSLLMHHMTANEDFTRFEPHTPQYKRFKNREFTSLTLKIMDQNNNIITDGLQKTVVLHIHDCKIESPLILEYGKQLNTERSLSTPKGIEGIRQKVIVTHNPSTINQAQDLLVRFPSLGNDDVIIPGMMNVSFNIELTSTTHPNRTLVSNIDRAIIKKLAVKFEGNGILRTDNYDVFACYQDLWKTASEKRNATPQGIISNGGDLTPNCMKLRINAE